MRTFMLDLPKGLRVDVFNVPEDFDEQVRKSFKEYTAGTSDRYTYQDKLAYIDLINEYAHRWPDPADEVNNYIKDRFAYELEENGNFLSECDFRTTEVMEDIYSLGRLKLYDHYRHDEHIDEEIMWVVARVIRVVMNYD